MDKRLLQNNKWVRRAAWLAGGVAALWAAGWLLVPPLLKGQVQKIASDKLGRSVSIGSVDFKPWSLELTVSDLAMATADGRADQVRVKRLYMDAELQSLLRLAPVVDAIAVDEPVVRLTHLGGGRYDMDDVLQKLAPAPDQPAAEPATFALYNLALNGGSLDFTDNAVGKTHTVRELRLTVPFLSNLDSKRDVHTEPHLAFRLNGSAFDTAAQTTPFAQTRKTDATIRLQALDLTPYLGYIPPSLPVRLQAAVLDVDLKIAFEQNPGPTVRLSGEMKASHFKLADAKLRDLLAFDHLKLSLTDVRPLAQTVKIADVALTAPTLSVHRGRDGRLNLALAATDGKTGASSPKAAEHLAQTPWKIDVGQVAVREGRLNWSDDATPRAPGAPARISLRDLRLDASGIAVPADGPDVQPIPFSGSAAVEAANGASASGATAALNFSGTASARSATVTATVNALPLSLAAPYAGQFMAPALGGTLSAALGVSWQAAAQGAAGGLAVRIDRLALDQLALTQGKTTLAAIQRVELADTLIDPVARSAVVGKLAVTNPRLKVERGADGLWMYEKWLQGGAEQPKAPAVGRAVAPTPWKLAINDLLLSGGTVGWNDAATPRPVALEVSALRVQLQNFALDGKKPAALQVAARVGAGRTEAGRLSYRGTLGLNPVATQGSVEAVHLPVHALEPYFGDALNIELLRADASFKGTLRYADSPAGPRVRVTGDTAIEEFRANTLAGLGDELLSWKALSLRGLDVSLAPGSATTVDVKETALSDFFARVIIRESGRINLQDIVKSTTGDTATTAAAVPAAPASASTVSIQAATAPAPVINVGPISLLNGKVNFSDRFVKPNYSANLTELTGKLSAFSSVPAGATPQLADLELRGRAEGTASLEILGQLNPLATPLALDIQGKVRDLELPPLSPYSVKYAGHGIERGKLNVDVAYRVLPDGQLTASNQIILNQLSFGDPVEGAPASLPVKLAVALLADRNGVIDINLPISGSLNDPQFRLGPIIVKVIVNLIVKAIASPFSLLAHAFGGGGDELSVVAFAPGSAALSAQAAQGLDKVAKALADRPALKMTVAGTAALDAEREGYKRERLQALVRAEKRRAGVVGGAAASDNGAVIVSAAEYPDLLRAVYKRADMPKPRNLVGMTKDIPQPEMEALLLANIPVTDDMMRELAIQRGVAVRDYLASRQLPLERLFLGAPKTGADKAAPSSTAPGTAPAWSPRAELALSTR